MTTREELAQRADELLASAFNATMDVLENKEAPPTARASATTSALKLWEILGGDDGDEKEQSEMTADEIRRSINRLEKRMQGEPDDTGDSAEE